MVHGNESPNDTGKSPTNTSGAARILHLDKNGRFINQWFGNNAGQGHFSMVHGLARADLQAGLGWQRSWRHREWTGQGRRTVIESNYMAMDSKGNLYTGDTSVARITMMIPPGK